MNKMTLTCFWNGARKDFSHYNDSIRMDDYMTQALSELFIINSCVNSSALLRPIPKGSSTEQAILKFMDLTAVNYESIR